ncbi:hypothetical protein Tco_1442489 [Tanacetum coccineum]
MVGDNARDDICTDILLDKILQGVIFKFRHTRWCCPKSKNITSIVVGGLEQPDMQHQGTTRAANKGTEAAEDRETTAETNGGQKIHVSLQKRRSSVLKEISSQVLDKWQLRQHVTTHSDIYNASSTDLSSPSSIATVIRGDQKQLYPHGLQKLPMNKRNSPLTPDAIETPSANVTSPEHTHAAQRRLRMDFL